MLTGWRYRVVGTMGTVGLIVGAVLLANHPVSQAVVTTYVPLFNRLEPQILDASALVRAIALSVIFVGGALVPLYKPQPRRVLDVVFLAQKRVLVGGLALAALGYFNWSYRLPRQTLVIVIGMLGIVIPAWFVWIRRRPRGDTGRTLIVGDDLSQIERVVPVIESPVLGYLCPSIVAGVRERDVDGEVVTDGGIADGGVALEYAETGTDAVGGTDLMEGVELERLGGLSRLEDILVSYDVDTVVLAFRQADRAEFFGALDACHDHGVAVKVHREYADSVLVSGGDVGELVEVDLEPWDPIDHLSKRIFDVIVSGTALLALSPIIVLIVIAIKLEGEGPVFFSQERTYLFGETFQIKKFRTLKPKPGGEVGTEIEDDRQTKLGTFLRTTHLDEIPQLWSIFAGHMSVVGPRPAQTELEPEFEQEAIEWKRRWFVKPGLTGLAQINDATSQEPAEKIQYDLQYIRNQSLVFDMKILLRQLWKVVEDVIELVGGN